MQQTARAQANLQDTVYKNRYIILTVILIGMLMTVLDGYMMSIALPTITAYFNVSIAESQWIITGYLVVMTGLFVVFGKASEYTGRAGLFMGGWGLFTLSSLACSFSTGIYMLIAFRICQAIGAAMVAGVSGALIFQAFPPKELGKALGYFGATVGLGSLIGPGLGGFIADKLGWQYIFLVNVPLGIVLLATALKYLKVPETTSDRLDMDWIGAVTLVVSVTSLMLFCGELANGLSITMPLVAYGIVFILSLAAFLFQESRHRNPLLDLSLFRNGKFSLPVASTLLFFLALNIAIILYPFYFEGVMGYDPSRAGVLFMLVPLAMMIASTAGGWLFDKYHWKFLAATGLLVSAIAFAILGLAYLNASFSLAIVALVLWGAGNGLFTSPNNAETMSAVPREKTAIASSISTTAKSLAGALGVSLASVFLIQGLGMAGYTGPVLGAGPSLLANTMGTIMFGAGALSLIAAALSAARNI
jgi:EmrB/QacA subfamily drug resistance transporter